MAKPDRAARGPRLYVYYRVAQADLARVAAAVQAMQAFLRAGHPGLDAQLLQRIDTLEVEPGSVSGGAAAGTLTLMECYAAPHGIDGTLRAAIDAAVAALPAQPGIGERHVEWFAPCP